jgi:hypothetical protein
MFWGRLKELNTPENVEWLDGAARQAGRVIEWDPPNKERSAAACLNSRGATRRQVRASLIGNEIAKGLMKLREAGEQELFIGVIAGWEHRSGGFRYWEDRRILRANERRVQQSPPAHIDAARSQLCGRS